jgi:hypothetical protein
VRYVHGALRWAQVNRGGTLYTGWVLCKPDGTPLEYPTNGGTGTIRVQASGSYMTES